MIGATARNFIAAMAGACVTSGLVIALGIIPIANASASDPSPAEVLNLLAQAANSGDLKDAEQLWTRSPTVIDDFAPFVWRGTRAVDGWWNDFGSFSKQVGMSDVHVRLLPALVSDVEGDRAYVVVPGVITGSMKGRPIRLTGRNTAVLDRGPAGWRIATWAWSDDAR